MQMQNIEESYLFPILINENLSASKVNSTNLLGVAGVKPSSSNCSFVIPRAAADFPDAYKFAPYLSAVICKSS